MQKGNSIKIWAATLLVAALCLACEVPVEIKESEALDLLDKWSQAYYQKDTDLLNEVLHDQYVYSGADGSRSPKQAVMNNLATDPSRILNQEFFDLDIRPYKHTVIVRGWEELTILGAAGDTSVLALRFIDVYIKEAGELKALATQSFAKE